MEFPTAPELLTRLVTGSSVMRSTVLAQHPVSVWRYFSNLGREQRTLSPRRIVSIVLSCGLEGPGSVGRALRLVWAGVLFFQVDAERRASSRAGKAHGCAEEEERLCAASWTSSGKRTRRTLDRGFNNVIIVNVVKLLSASMDLFKIASLLIYYKNRCCPRLIPPSRWRGRRYE